MAIFKNSTFGTIRKAIGDDVAYRMGGQNIIRKKPAQINDANSVKQREQRTAMTLIVALFRFLSSLVKTSFPERSARHSAYNVFSSLNVKNAVKKADGSAIVELDKLQIAKGSLPAVVATSFADQGDGTANVTFTNQADGNVLLESDKLIIAKVSADSFKLGKVVEVSLSSTLPTAVDASEFESGEQIAVYAFHKSADLQKVSDSVYLGSISA